MTVLCKHVRHVSVLLSVPQFGSDRSAMLPLMFTLLKTNAVLVALGIITIQNVLTQGARILAVIPVYARSHHRFSQPVLKALAGAGHEVVVYSPYPLDNPVPNYHDVFLENVATADNKTISEKVMRLIENPHRKCLDLNVELFEEIFNPFVNSEKIQNLVKSGEKFDLVITETYCTQEFTLILGRIFKAPVIALHSFLTNSVVNTHAGNDLSVSFIPDTCGPFSNKMTFYERLFNYFYVVRNFHYVYHSLYLPMVDSALRAHFPGFPPLSEMMHDVSLIFVNDHLTADYARPRTPNIIPVAGIHIEDVKPLPKDIQKFMDEAPDGVILFSLGTNIPDELHPKEYFDMFIHVFSQLKQRVLWKTRKQNIEGLSDNVKTLKWLPQRDILEHPNCVLFITHAGLLSQHETVHCGVPVVAIPQFFDQHRNARFCEEKGIGVQLNSQELSKDNILDAVRKVLGNPEYTDTVKRLSRVFKDRPKTPAETVVYWAEYVLRHGASPLRPASTHLAWYQLALLDVLAVILAATVSISLIMYYIVSRICKYTFYRTHFNPIEKKLN